MSHIVVIGGDGNMGQRYMGWLRALGVLAVSIDIDSSWEEWGKYLKEAKGAIIATPTDSHVKHVVRTMLHRRDFPLLVEKPLSKDSDALLNTVLPAWEAAGTMIQMVDQYAFMPRYEVDNSDGWTIYESSHSGKDGIAWDCINIIGKAADITKVRLSNTHPVNHWRCQINGEALYLPDMAQAYKDMVKDWLENPEPNFSYIKKSHQKVKDYIEWCKGRTKEAQGS